MQIYADVTGRELKIGESPQAPALGSAMFGAVAAGRAAGGYDSIIEASARDGPAAARPCTAPIRRIEHVYDDLFAEYRVLHDYFGRGANDVMKRLKSIRSRALAEPCGRVIEQSSCQRSKRRCRTAWMEIEIRMIAP